jgi:hypothetical protein
VIRGGGEVLLLWVKRHVALLVSLLVDHVDFLGGRGRIGVGSLRRDVCMGGGGGGVHCWGVLFVPQDGCLAAI